MSAIFFDRVDLRIGVRRILGDASFTIPEGAFVGVLGPNGAGKTTLLRSILGLQAPSAGRMTVLGRAPHRGDPRIGYMPQFRRGTAQLRLSGFDLVVGALGGARWARPFASRDERRLAEAALAEVGAADLAARPVSDLSGGERQRVLFAQALLGDPALLLLDEPLISLDPGHQRGIVDAVKRVAARRGSTVLFCAHEINPLLDAVDLVLYLVNGKAVLGPVDEVIDAAVLSKLYGTPIHVARHMGRIFVMAHDGELDVHAHNHDHPHEQ